MQWPSLRSTVDLPNGAAAGRRRDAPAPMAEEPTPLLDNEDEPSGSTQALSPEQAMKLLAGVKKAMPFAGTAAPASPETPREERTLSPDEATALARKLAEPVPSEAEPVAPLRRPTSTSRRPTHEVELAKPHVHTGPMPAVAPAKTAVASPRAGQPDIVLRAPGFQAPSVDVMDDEDSSIGSTVAFSPEAAAELLARRVAGSGRGAPQSGALSPSGQGLAAARAGVAPDPPPPAPPPAQPPPLMSPAMMPPAAVAPPMMMDDDPADSSAGSTMAFSPEAAAELIAQRMAQLGVARMPVPPPPAPPPPAPPPPTGPTLTRTNTVVMDLPPELAKPPGGKR